MKLAKIFDIPRTFFLNLKLFSFKDAIKMPIFFEKHVKVKGLKKGCIVLPENKKRFMIRIGFDDVEGISKRRKSLLWLGKGATIVFKGECGLAKGVCIRNSSGTIVFGKNTYFNSDATFICADLIQIGDNSIFGWNVTLRDCDGHKITYDNGSTNQPSRIMIGQHCWVGQDVKILKNVEIGDNCVVAMNSCLTKSIFEQNVIIGGYPAKILKKNIKWQV